MAFLINIFQDFCTRKVNLRSPIQRHRLRVLERELPALWSSLHEILIFERTSSYLPRDVAQIVEKLISMRHDIFSNAPERNENDYIRSLKYYIGTSLKFQTIIYPINTIKSHIHTLQSYNLTIQNTGCTKNEFPICFLLLYCFLLIQIVNVGGVLKNSGNQSSQLFLI